MSTRPASAGLVARYCVGDVGGERQLCSRRLCTLQRRREGGRLWFFTEDAEYHVAREDPDSAVHRGIDAVRRQFARWVEAYPDLTVEPLEAKGNGDMVFLWVRFSGHGAGSGVPVEMELAHLLTMRDGKVARTVEYLDRDEALEAAGLRE
jgi:ketosteroid isomerase-like protein